MLDHKFEGVYSSPSKTAARPAGDSLSVLKLEGEIKEIKEMMMQFSK